MNCPVNGGSGQICTHNAGFPPQHCPDNNFEKPPGADARDGSRAEFGHIIATDIITGSVRTFQANGNKNGDAKPVDYTHIDSILDLAEGNLEVTGLYRLPVCSHGNAWDAWKAGPRDSDIFPCNDPKAKKP